MPLTHNQFNVIYALHNRPGATQREIADRNGMGLATVNAAYKEAQAAGYIENGRLTDAGEEALAPYAVDNAVIMAAGTSSRFAPISYEQPKGMLKVRGEVLIERQIEQLRQAGVTEIAVVTGYKKEAFFYLEEKYGAKIIVNTAYAECNNSVSLLLAADLLANTYICSSDNYFAENPFESHVWKAYYSAEYSEGETNEWCITTGSHDRITKVEIGGSDAWYMIGHVFFDREFSERFRTILKEAMALPQTKHKLWESIYVEHIKELDMRIRRFDPPIIFEFDSLDELREFDPLFLENLDSEIFANIEAVLGCNRNDIHDIFPLKQGLTNLSCHFATNDGEFVYRHPGAGTELIVDREGEREALLTAQRLGLDDTYIFENPERGWKISRFIPDCRNLDSSDDAQLKVAMEMARKLHESGTEVSRYFNFYVEGKGYEQKVLERQSIDMPDYWEMSRQAEALSGYITAEDNDPVLCHNDFFGLNFLVDKKGAISLIDWEYSGMSDYANDFGTFCVCEQLSDEQMMRALEYYFGRTPTPQEVRHNLAMVGLAGWCWYAWALLKEAEGEDVGEWSYIYYRYGKAYLKKALDLYEQAC